MNILITGVAGFIGFHTAMRYLAQGENVIGIDSLNDYYDVSLKEARLSKLSDYDKFEFFKLDINNKESLDKIECPTLCIFGDLDKMVPLKVGNKMAEIIKNSQVKVIQNCGHMIIYEKAFEMRKLVKEFLLN